MGTRHPRELRERVERAAEAALEVNGSVGPLELLQQMQWLAPSHLTLWCKGIIPSLAELMQGSPEKRRKAFRHFQEWAQKHGAPQSLGSAEPLGGTLIWQHLLQSRMSQWPST